MSVQRWAQTHYSPEDDIKALLDSLPTFAMRSIDCEIYGFTDAVLVTALVAAALRGVHVRVNNDRSQSTGPADRVALLTLAAAPNVEIRVTESEHGAIDHLKMMVLDGADGAESDSSSVFSGSFNWSDGAQRQDNVVRWSNDPGEVAQALAKFTHDWTHNKQLPEWQIKVVTPPSV